jgi:hypothetical protein
MASKSKTQSEIFKEEIIKEINSSVPDYINLLEKFKITKEEMITKINERNSIFFTLLFDFNKEDKKFPYERIIKIYLLSQIKTYINILQVNIDIYYSLPLNLLGSLYNRLKTDRRMGINEKGLVKIINELDVPDISEDISSPDILILLYNITRKEEYKQYISQFLYTPESKSLKIGINLITQDEETCDKISKFYEIYFIYFLLTMCYFINLNREEAIIIIQKFLLLDDNSQYYIDKILFEFIDELLTFDRQLGLINTSEFKPLMIDLVNIQGTIFIKKIKEEPELKQVTQKKGRWFLSRTLTETHRYGDKQPIRGDISSRGRQAITSTSSNDLKKYLRYKVKYLILKTLMNI